MLDRLTQSRWLSLSLLSFLIVVLAKRGTDFINGERIFFPVFFKENARQKDRFELFMKLLAAETEKEEAGLSKDARLIFFKRTPNFSRNRVYIEGNLVRRIASKNDFQWIDLIFLLLNRLISKHKLYSRSGIFPILRVSIQIQRFNNQLD